MGQRILFACAECESALIWPVDAEPQSATSVRPVNDGSYLEARDLEGHPVVVVHPKSRWKARVESCGTVVCPEGHRVGTAVKVGEVKPAFLSLDCRQVISRQMRGRV